jgi:hypothetical protein
MGGRALAGVIEDPEADVVEVEAVRRVAAVLTSQILTSQI